MHSEEVCCNAIGNERAVSFILIGDEHSAYAEGIRDLKRITIIAIVVVVTLTACRAEIGGDAATTVAGTPEPTATHPVTSSVRVGKWNSTQQDGTFWVFGEILNTGWNAVHNIETEVTLLDAEGELLRQGNAVHLTTLPPGDRGFFYADFEGLDEADIGEVTFATGAEPGVSPELYTDYIILDLNANERDDGSVIVSGVVQNLGAVRAESVHVFAIGYDDAGDVVLVQHGISPLEGIGPGQSWAFEQLDFGGIAVSLPRTTDAFAVGSLP